MRRNGLTGLLLTFFFGFSAVAQTTVPTDSAGSALRRITSPQIVSGGDFSTDLVLLNLSSTNCDAQINFHLGAGLSPQDSILTNGQDLGFNLNVNVPGGAGTQTLNIASTGQGLFTGAATVEIRDPACFNSVTVQTQYRILDGQNLTELFSYPSPLPIPLHSCAVAPVNFDPDPLDGTLSIPGFANVSFDPLTGVDRTMELLDSQGNLIATSPPQTYDGRYGAQLLNEFFPQQGPFQGSWRVCYPGLPQTGQEPTVIDTLFINIAQGGDGTQFASNAHDVQNPACQPDGTTLCLNDDRFKVEVNWADPPLVDQPGFVQDIKPDDTGFFFFLDPGNTEILVKVLDGCSFNNNFWVFYAATTDVEYTITVVDTQTNLTKEYFNPLGQASPAVTDTQAFATCP